MVVIVTGVAGSGKTTVGIQLAAALGWPFREGDDDHPAANVAKMARGEPLLDLDRWPWLDRLRARVADALRGGQDLVLTCSALKESYRQRLRIDPSQVRFVYLEIPPELAARRLHARQGHFMKESMVPSQFADVQPPPPEEALILDARQPPEALVAGIRAALDLG